jgi:hypothetical protein
MPHRGRARRGVGAVRDCLAGLGNFNLSMVGARRYMPPLRLARESTYSHSVQRH